MVIRYIRNTVTQGHPYSYSTMGHTMEYKYLELEDTFKYAFATKQSVLCAVKVVVVKLKRVFQRYIVLSAVEQEFYACY